MPRKTSYAYRELVLSLADLRTAKGMSQHDLAAATGSSQAFVSRVERMEAELGMDEFLAWVDALQAHGDLLLEEFWTNATKPRKAAVRRR